MRPASSFFTVAETVGHHYTISAGVGGGGRRKGEVEFRGPRDELVVLEPLVSEGRGAAGDSDAETGVAAQRQREGDRCTWSLARIGPASGTVGPRLGNERRFPTS